MKPSPRFGFNDTRSRERGRFLWKSSSISFASNTFQCVLTRLTVCSVSKFKSQLERRVRILSALFAWSCSVVCQTVIRIHRYKFSQYGVHLLYLPRIAGTALHNSAQSIGTWAGRWQSCLGRQSLSRHPECSSPVAKAGSVAMCCWLRHSAKHTIRVRSLSIAR